MNSATAIDPNITMRELLEQFPGAQRAMFRKYHIGGCSSCGFSPDETLAGVCARNENVNVDEAIEHIIASDAAERAMQIEPRDLAEKIASDEKTQSSRRAHARGVGSGKASGLASIYPGVDAGNLEQVVA